MTWHTNTKPPDYLTTIGGPPPKRTLCGLKRRCFWVIIVVVVIVVIAAAVTGGVVGSRKANSSVTPDSNSKATPTASAPPPNPTSPQHGTALTVPVLGDNTTAADAHIVVYQSFSHELFYSRVNADGSSGMPSALGDEFKAIPNTPLAAIAFTDNSGTTKPTVSALHIHVFYLDNSSFLSDAVLINGVWRPGTLRLQNIVPYNETKLAAIIWVENNIPIPWIYSQAKNGYVIEYGRAMSGRWMKDENSSLTIDLRLSPGSGLATCYDIDEKGFQRLKVYGQIPDGAIVSRDYTEEAGKGWSEYYPVYQAEKAVKDISTVTKRSNMTAEEITLFFVQEGGGMDELGWTKAKGWAKVPEYIVEGSGGKVAAVQDSGGITRAYFQEGNETVIKEAVLGADSKWVVTRNTIG
jgi:hypothetical protein